MSMKSIPFYIVKLGFTGYTYFCYIIPEADLTCTHNQCFEQIIKDIKNFLMKFSIFTFDKKSLYIA